MKTWHCAILYFGYRRKKVYLNANFRQFLKIKLWCFYLMLLSATEFCMPVCDTIHSSKPPFPSTVLTEALGAVRSIRCQYLNLVVASSAHGWTSLKVLSSSFCCSPESWVAKKSNCLVKFKVRQYFSQTWWSKVKGKNASGGRISLVMGDRSVRWVFPLPYSTVIFGVDKLCNVLFIALILLVRFNSVSYVNSWDYSPHTLP